MVFSCVWWFLRLASLRLASPRCWLRRAICCGGGARRTARAADPRARVRCSAVHPKWPAAHHAAQRVCVRSINSNNDNDATQPTTAAQQQRADRWTRAAQPSVCRLCRLLCVGGRAHAISQTALVWMWILIATATHLCSGFAALAATRGRLIGLSAAARPCTAVACVKATVTATPATLFRSSHRSAVWDCHSWTSTSTSEWRCPTRQQARRRCDRNSRNSDSRNHSSSGRSSNSNHSSNSRGSGNNNHSSKLSSLGEAGSGSASTATVPPTAAVAPRSWSN